METWKSPCGESVRSFAIVTTEPNELCAELHNRIPVLRPETWPIWLGEEPADEAQLKSSLAPPPFGCNDLLAGQQTRWQRQRQTECPNSGARLVRSAGQCIPVRIGGHLRSKTACSGRRSVVSQVVKTTEAMLSMPLPPPELET